MNMFAGQCGPVYKYVVEFIPYKIISYQIQVLLAAAYLDDARSGTHMEFEPTVSAVNMYQTYKSWWFTGILYLALGIILALAIFEEPAASASYLPLPFYITVCNYFINHYLKNMYIFVSGYC